MSDPAPNTPAPNTPATPTGNEWGITSGTSKGFDAITTAAGTKLAATATNLTTALSDFNPTDPKQLMKMQVDLATYNLAITTVSGIIKSVEDTLKSVAQKL